jgi:hypothetical protein
VDNEKTGRIEAFLDGGLPAPELQGFIADLQTDPKLRREFSACLRMHGLLHAALDRDVDCERLAEVVATAIRTGDRPFESRVMEQIQKREIRGRSRLPWTRIAAVAAAGLVLAIGTYFSLHVPSPARFASASPDVVVERGREKVAAAAGVSLQGGDTVTVPPKGWASIRWPDGTTLEIAPDSALVMKEGPGKKLLVSLGRVSADVAPQPAGRPMILTSPHAEATVLGTSLSLAVSPEGTRLQVRHGLVGFSKGEGQPTIDVQSGQAAIAARGKPIVAEPIGSDVLRKLGKDHFMLGVMNGYGERWVSETRAQGCRFDLRYQHLAWNWTGWNSGGGFIPLYLQESDRLGVTAVFSYYAMIQASPGKDTGMGPAAAIAVNCVNRETMTKYFSDLQLFMKKAGEHGKPLILHVEPEVWGLFLSSPEFKPNVPEKIRVEVKSTGLADFEGLDDTLVSFGKAFSLLRDRYAPNVILAWHASKRPGVPSRAVAEALRSCGDWDFIFTDVGDRDAAFREARGDSTGWWTDKEFADFRRWGAELHALTGLPLMVWRIPLGNTVMATCDNTPWHYMDNRVEHWLEKYPENRNIADWAAAGFVGLLFGGGTMECTVHKDNAKDGVTNPAPIKGNKGETSAFPDDDGGYLRLRAGSYYKNGPLPLPEK